MRDAPTESGDNAAVACYPKGKDALTYIIVTRDRVDGSRLLAPDNRKIFLYDMASYEEIYSGLTDPIIESDYDAYLQDGYLTYIRGECNFAEGQKFLLQVYPADVNDLPEHRREHGYAVLDPDPADPRSYIIRLPNRCVAKRMLPDYEFARIITGG